LADEPEDVDVAGAGDVEDVDVWAEVELIDVDVADKRWLAPQKENWLTINRVQKNLKQNRMIGDLSFFECEKTTYYFDVKNFYHPPAGA
jgi:hypothetical protein